MGIPTVYAALLARAREQGVDFRSVATIGRQSLTVPLPELQRLAERLGRDEVSADELSGSGYAEGFLTSVLGATDVTSFDFSSYEGADVTHDFNSKIDPSFHRSFDTVIDGGSIEHIFDIRTVFSNYMSMVKVGGSIFIHAPANNLMGHGFYQFCPELFYRVFSEGNGFQVREICLTETPFTSVEVSPKQRCYATRDPHSVGRRINLVNDRPVMIFVHAQCTADRPLFGTAPMQSDFAAQWTRHEESKQASKAARVEEAKEAKAFNYANRKQAAKYRRRQKQEDSFKNRDFFTALDP